MIKLMHCPFCGGEYFLFGKNENFRHDESITCPDCGTICKLGKLETYRKLSPCEKYRGGVSC